MCACVCVCVCVWKVVLKVCLWHWKFAWCVLKRNCYCCYCTWFLPLLTSSASSVALHCLLQTEGVAIWNGLENCPCTDQWWERPWLTSSLPMPPPWNATDSGQGSKRTVSRFPSAATTRHCCLVILVLVAVVKTWASMLPTSAGTLHYCLAVLILLTLKSQVRTLPASLRTWHWSMSYRPTS